MRILIIDDHEAYRQWLAHHITAEWTEAGVIGHDPRDGSLLPPGRKLADFDLVFLDYRWDGGGGLTALASLSADQDCPPVVMLTAQGGEAMARDAIAAGAHDVMPKGQVSHQDVVRVIRESVRDRRPPGGGGGGDGARGGGNGFALKGHRYVRLLGEGSLSRVHLLEEIKTSRPVVVKVLNEVPETEEGEREKALERFLQEYELISSIRHPNVVRIYDLGIADDHAFIVMEYFAAGDLRHRIGQGLPGEKAIEYLGQMARALAAIHDVGVLHRDLKPGNVMLREDDSLALIDFGLAKQTRVSVELTATGLIFGTPYYMSPEQGHGDTTDERADIYSLGVIFYEMITGEKPYTAGSPMAVIYKHTHAEIPILPPQAARYQPLLDRLMAKRPEDRFNSAKQLVATLRQMKLIA